MNVTAGTGNIRLKMLNIIEELSRKGCEVTVYPVIPKEGLTSEHFFASENVAERFDLVACCGGDGTLNHLINDMMNHEVPLPIGYIPAGSTNDFSRNLNGDLTALELCGVLAGEKTFSYDIGCLNGRYFNYVAGFGAFTKISYSTDQNMKNIFGYGAYMMNMLATLPQNVAMHHHVIVEHDGLREEDDYVFGGLTNSLSIAGVKSPILDHAQLNDGLFEVLLVKAPKNLQQINEIVQSLASGKTDNPFVSVVHTSRVTFTSTDGPLSWTLDGEYGGTYDRAVVDVIPQAIEIMVN